MADRMVHDKVVDDIVKKALGASNPFLRDEVALAEVETVYPGSVEAKFAVFGKLMLAERPESTQLS